MSSAAPASSSASAEAGVQQHLLPLADCPPAASFRCLILTAREGLAAGQKAAAEIQPQQQAPPADGAAASDAPAAASASAAAAPSSPSPDLLSVLTSLTDWCAALFLVHDRAVSSNALLIDLTAALERIQSESQLGAGGAAASPFAALASRLGRYPFPLIERVGHEIGELRHTCASEHIDSSWTVLDAGLKGDRIGTYYRAEPSGGTHSFLVDGVVDAPLLNLVAMLREAPLLHKWLPGVKESTLVSSLDHSRYRMLMRIVIKMPVWPIADREAMCYGYGDVLGDSVGVYFRSTEEGETFPGAAADGSDVTVPPTSPGCVRVHVRLGGFYVTPLSPSSTRVRACFNVDPKFPILPYWFINTMAKRFCAVIINMMRQKAPKLFAPGSDYSNQLEREKRVYDEIRHRLATEVEAKEG